MSSSTPLSWPILAMGLVLGTIWRLAEVDTREFHEYDLKETPPRVPPDSSLDYKALDLD